MKKSKNRQLVISLVLTLIALAITGCSNTIANTQADFTKESREVRIENKEHYINDLTQFILTGETTDIFDNVVIDNNDILVNVEINNYYYFNSSIYLQIGDDMMYRFQLDSNNKVVSYIKYNLEA